LSQTGTNVQDADRGRWHVDTIHAPRSTGDRRWLRSAATP
jgi:hypothetical protein